MERLRFFLRSADVAREHVVGGKVLLKKKLSDLVDCGPASDPISVSGIARQCAVGGSYTAFAGTYYLDGVSKPYIQIWDATNVEVGPAHMGFAPTVTQGFASEEFNNMFMPYGLVWDGSKFVGLFRYDNDKLAILEVDPSNGSYTRKDVTVSYLYQWTTPDYGAEYCPGAGGTRYAAIGGGNGFVLVNLDAGTAAKKSANSSYRERYPSP